MLSRKFRYLLSVLSGLLLVVSFPHTGSIFFLGFVAWVPLLMVEHNIYLNKYKPSKVLLHAYITFFIYNIGSTYWIYYAKGGEAGAILAYFLNGFLMALVFFLYHLTKRFVGAKEAYIGLVFYWLGFEYVHFQWELSWPWISIGNIFAWVPELVQWYSYTGVLGGGLWLLLINLLIFRIVSNMFFKKESFKIQTPLVYFTAFLVVLPIAISLFTYYGYTEKEDPIEVVITQPNVDPYNEKFSADVIPQLDKFLSLADAQVSEKTQFVLAPETAIAEPFNEADFENSISYLHLKDQIRKWNGPALLVGASTYKIFEQKNSRASREMKNGYFYEPYNTSLLMSSLNPPEFVHKSKLVLGVEKIPFSQYLPWLEKLSIQNGGTSGTLGVEPFPKVMQANGVVFAPVICYESVYGEFISKQCLKGAQVIFIITNDGWWENTAGHKQHNSIARLRAIETRRSIARSANTGISSVINQRGDVVEKTNYWEEAVISAKLNLNSEPTFYVIYGDVIGRASAFVFVLLAFYTLVKYLRKFGKSYR